MGVASRSQRPTDLKIHNTPTGLDCSADCFSLQQRQKGIGNTFKTRPGAHRAVASTDNHRRSAKAIVFPRCQWDQGPFVPRSSTNQYQEWQSSATSRHIRAVTEREAEVHTAQRDAKRCVTNVATSSDTGRDELVHRRRARAAQHEMSEFLCLRIAIQRGPTARSRRHHWAQDGQDRPKDIKQTEHAGTKRRSQAVDMPFVGFCDTVQGQVLWWRPILRSEQNVNDMGQSSCLRFDMKPKAGVPASGVGSEILRKKTIASPTGVTVLNNRCSTNQDIVSRLIFAQEDQFCHTQWF